MDGCPEDNFPVYQENEMEQEKYYLAYEERYKTVYEAGLTIKARETDSKAECISGGMGGKHYSLHGKMVITEFAWWGRCLVASHSPASALNTLAWTIAPAAVNGPGCAAPVYGRQVFP